MADKNEISGGKLPDSAGDPAPQGRSQDIDPVTGGPSTRRRILDAGRAEFAQHGKAGARVNRIAEAAGVNKAMIYYHFNSKQELYLSVIHDVFGQISELASKRAFTAENLEGVFTGLAESYAEIFHRFPDIRSILMRELAVESAMEIDGIASVFRESGVPAGVMAALGQGMNEGTVREVNLQQTMVSFAAINIGYFLMAPMVDRILGITDRTAFIEERRRAVVDPVSERSIGEVTQCEFKY